MKNLKVDIRDIADTVPIIYKRTTKFNGYINFKNTHIVEDMNELKKINKYYAGVIPMGENIYMHNSIDGICFNVLYASRHPYSHGDRFCITDILKVHKNTTLVRVLFEHSLHTITIPIKTFYSGYIYNPYHIRYFGCCSIGNIDILNHKDEFYCWWETINRCFNPCHPANAVYRGAGLITPYLCFEDLVKKNNELKRKYDCYSILVDPNDRLLYMNVQPLLNIQPIYDTTYTTYMNPDGYRGVQTINRMKYITMDDDPPLKLTIDQNYGNIVDRSAVFNKKHAGGRPKKVKNKLIYELKE